MICSIHNASHMATGKRPLASPCAPAALQAYERSTTMGLVVVSAGPPEI
jgi:hypothetical protein